MATPVADAAWRGDPTSVVEEWAALEVAPWRHLGLKHETLLSALREQAVHDPMLCIFLLSEGDVESLPLSEGRLPLDVSSLLERRRILYRDLLRAAVARDPVEGQLAIGMRLSDRAPDAAALPLFGFQKRRGDRTILLPDVDFLTHDFYRSPAFHDPHAFLEKAPTAFFVGSATGGAVTLERLRRGDHARLAAAQFFRDKPDVDFTIVGPIGDLESTWKKLARSVPVRSEARGWQDHFRSRYLLSMDGNGATCSRVAVALLSHAALVKYNSPWLLYYFHAMMPWRHYVPVREHEDVIALTGGALGTERRDVEIAEEGRRFAQAFLSRDAVLSYTSALLRCYGALFTDS